MTTIHLGRTHGRSRARAARLQVSELERREMLAIFSVTSIGDGSDTDLSDGVCDDGAGGCTLRAAIEQANFDAGFDTIEFRIAGLGPHTIQPVVPLPAVDDSLIIDGTTQPGFAGLPVIELDGSALSNAPAGLEIRAGNSTVRGLVINRFPVDAIVLRQKGGNVIEGNLIGTDVTGTVPRGNGADGVFIVGCDGNRVGTDGDGVDDAAERNVISGNGEGGVRIVADGSDENVVAGNLIGTDVTGTVAMGNAREAVAISQGKRNRIGTNGDGIADEAERNILSASRRFSGVVIDGAGTDENIVAGNFIGTDVTGTVALGNGDAGVAIRGGARSNRIGTNGDGVADAAEGNVISGNLTSGIGILNAGTDGNVVAGNRIGTDVSGARELGNVFHGVVIFDGARHNRIGTNGDGVADAAERNIISGNRRFEGVAIEGTGTDSNVVAGNFIGTDLTGTAPLGNGEHGVSIFSGAQFNRIGSNADGVADDAERNVISGNLEFGVTISNPGTSGNVVAGNHIGTDLTGTVRLGNRRDGVIVFSQATNNVIGGATAAERNLISGNRNGVRLSGVGVTGNVVQGNFIGTDVTGTSALGNTRFGVDLDGGASENTVGGQADGSGNLISGNDGGVRMLGAGTSFNRIEGNFIGTDRSGTFAIGNNQFGVLIAFEASSNRVGDTLPGARNIISATNGPGVWLSNTSWNLVAGNFIGTDVSGTTALGNTADGVLIEAGARSNQIGVHSWAAADPAGGNLISGNAVSGVRIAGAGTGGNFVAGNRIGTDVSGTVALGNGVDGVSIVDASSNMIGGVTEAARNLISGNGLPAAGSGVTITGTDATFNQVLGNFIGSDVTGTGAIGNGWHGVDVRSSTNFIGGFLPQTGNLISGNGAHGIAFLGPDAAQNSVLNNRIGTDESGTQPLGNMQSGVFIESGSGNTIGALPAIFGQTDRSRSHRAQVQDELIAGNIIAFNGTSTDHAGIRIVDGTGNRVFHASSIFSNAGLGIDLGPTGVTGNEPGDADAGANGLQNFPQLTSGTRRRGRVTVHGQLHSAPHGTFRIDFYTSPAPDPTAHGEGKQYLDSVMVTTDASGNGSFSRRLRRGVQAEWITAIATDIEGNSSEFSTVITVVDLPRKHPEDAERSRPARASIGDRPAGRVRNLKAR